MTDEQEAHLSDHELDCIVVDFPLELCGSLLQPALVHTYAFLCIKEIQSKLKNVEKRGSNNNICLCKSHQDSTIVYSISFSLTRHLPLCYVASISVPTDFMEKSKQSLCLNHNLTHSYKI